MSEREELEQAMAALEKQRTVLGDAAVEAAIAGLRRKLAALDAREPSLSPTVAGERRVVTILFCGVKGSTAWMNHAKRHCQTALKQSLKCRTTWPEAMRLQGTYEWLRERPAAAQKWWQKGLDEAERMGQRYDVAMIHLEMGQRLSERERLEMAETIFSDIGAELDLARTRELLGR